MTALLDVRSDDLRTADAAAPRVAVLLLHGYGSNERDLAGLVPMLGLDLPWASLRAPLPAGPGAAWFEITTPGSPDAQPVEAATAAVWDWVDEHLDAATRVVPIGFSQGGLMASQLLRTRPDRVIAPVVLGGFVLGSAQPADAALAASRPPAFWGRGAEDRVIAAHAVARTAEWLPRHTTLVERVYPGLAHGISPGELADVRAFLAAHLPPGE
ncbi:MULTISPECIES: alpha/beta hydrolase [unclassified Agromyces]|uniref:alpha/beta hydrolase n=1 Tax=unclassified Agromyces TaxID=2639701 RepID=UPI0030149DBD